LGNRGEVNQGFASAVGACVQFRLAHPEARRRAAP
jgi:hypothetical protein